MPISEETARRRDEVLGMLNSAGGTSDPSVTAIVQLLSSAVDDSQVYYGLLGVKMIHANKLAGIQAILDSLSDVEPQS